MAKKARLPMTPIPHDHFDGSANCIECQGPCKLTGSQLLATRLLRFTLEGYAIQWANPPLVITGILGEYEIPWQHFWERAKQTTRAK